MKSQARNDEIKLFRFEREILRIANTEGNVGDAALLRAFAGDREHSAGEVNTNRFPRDAGESFSDVAGAGGDVENTLVACQASGSNQAMDAFFVGDPGIGSEGFRLCGEGFADDVVVLWHKPPGLR